MRTLTWSAILPEGRLGSSLVSFERLPDRSTAGFFSLAPVGEGVGEGVDEGMGEGVGV